MTKVELIIFLFVVVPILLMQGFWMFNDARKRGYRFYWVLGILGLTNIPTNLLIYLAITRLIIDRAHKNK